MSRWSAFWCILISSAGAGFLTNMMWVSDKENRFSLLVAFVLCLAADLLIIFVDAER